MKAERWNRIDELFQSALQLPAEVHDTEVREALPPWLRAAVPGTSFALPQVPFTSLTTNASP